MARRNEKLSFKSPKWTLRGARVGLRARFALFSAQVFGVYAENGHFPSHKLLLPVPAVNREYVAGVDPQQLPGYTMSDSRLSWARSGMFC